MTKSDVPLKHVNIQNLKFKIISYTTIFIGAVLLLDWFIFSFLFLKIPNELEWDTSPWYNFLQKKETIHFDKNNISILVAGSSVALYSYLPQDVDNELSKSGLNSKSEFFGHVAMSPTDLYYYAEDMISKKPSMILYLVNPGDYQMDYFLQLNKGFDIYSEDIRIHAYVHRHPIKYYYPLQYLMDNFQTLQKTEILPLLTKSLLYVNRYRSFIYDPIDAYLERHARAGRSYHNYTGAHLTPIQWRKGWTAKKFDVNCDFKESSDFTESVFIPNENTELKITSQSTELYKNSFKKSGWHKINFSIPENLKADTIPLSFEVSNVVSSKLIDNKKYGKEYFYGIRLPQNFCKSIIEKDISFLRINSMDDQILEQMSDSEYQNDYFEKMYKDADEFLDKNNTIQKRPEVQRLYHLHKVKQFLNTKGKYRWSEFNYLEKTAEKFKNANIPFIIVNNPENPLELNLYRDSEWYKGYLEFYEELGSKYSVKFYDKKDSVPKLQNFIDSHHLTYTGATLMSPIYSSIVKENKR
ncbi:MAG: hypothetical protein IPL26_05300 [Leptospiraceae bacterium]|nr:hypothetical protein [Leptospiraceae bacterium]